MLMQKEVQRAEGRGKTEAGWLHSRHSFSFGEYYDPGKMGFGALRVLNDDVIGPGKGFGTHPHDNMEIITIVLEGELAHKDSERNAGVLKHGDVQVMSAGSGLTHSEYNNSNSKHVALLQIWVETKERDIVPSYSQKTFVAAAKRDKFVAVASGMKHKGALHIHQDAVLSLALLAKDWEIDYVPAKPDAGRGVYLFVIEGRVKAGGEVLGKRDAIGIAGCQKLSIEALRDSELLVIEVPMQK
jgi:hypothetical protein